MELTVKIKDKKMYDSFVQFFKSVGIQIINEQKEKTPVKKTGEFKALRLKTKGKSFNREEANER